MTNITTLELFVTLCAERHYNVSHSVQLAQGLTLKDGNEFRIWRDEPAQSEFLVSIRDRFVHMRSKCKIIVGPKQVTDVMGPTTIYDWANPEIYLEMIRALDKGRIAYPPLCADSALGI